MINRYHFVRGRLQTRSFNNAILRLYNICSRYGINPEPFSNTLHHFMQFFKQFQFKPCLPVTASILKRYSSLFQHIQDMGAEIAIHGFKHIDYTQLGDSQIEDHLEKAVEIFDQYKIHFTGFRFPFLRRNKRMMHQQLQKYFIWDSSEAISWDILNPDQFSKFRWSCYNKILSSYEPINEKYSASIPRFINTLVELPVSLPDDDILFERLRIKNLSRITQIWEKIWELAVDKGELVVLAVHPERFFLFKSSIQKILEQMAHCNEVWTPTFLEIAEWWKERKNFSFKVIPISRNRYQVLSLASEKATILQKDHSQKINHHFYEDFSLIQEKSWELVSVKKPIIGVAPDTDSDILQFIQNEGYAFEISVETNKYNLYISNNSQSDGGIVKQCKVQEMIKNTKAPLIRFWRWPYRKRACVAISGDIDSVTLLDFGERFYD